jgi:hypothetical protein
MKSSFNKHTTQNTQKLFPPPMEAWNCNYEWQLAHNIGIPYLLNFVTIHL